MFYAVKHLKTKKFIAKISEQNTTSIELFKNLGFIQMGSANIFKEIQFQKIFDGEDSIKILNETVSYVEEKPYEIK